MQDVDFYYFDVYFCRRSYLQSYCQVAVCSQKCVVVANIFKKRGANSRIRHYESIDKKRPGGFIDQRPTRSCALKPPLQHHYEVYQHGLIRFGPHAGGAYIQLIRDHVGCRVNTPWSIISRIAQSEINLVYYFLAHGIARKFYTQSLHICSPHLQSVATVP